MSRPDGCTLQAAAGHDAVLSDDLASELRWPGFGSACTTGTGIRSVLSVPLPLPMGDRAALTFYSDEGAAFTERHVTVAEVFAPFVALAVRADVEAGRCADLERALASSRTIGTAIGIVMVRELLTEEQAFPRLLGTSQHLNVKLRDIADRVRETGAVPVMAGSGRAGCGQEHVAGLAPRRANLRRTHD